MMLNGLGEGVDVVPSFEQADAAALAMLGGGFEEQSGQFGEVLRFQSQRADRVEPCLLYTSPSPRDKRQSRMPSSA